MKEMWCDYYNELEAEFEEFHNRKPKPEEEFELGVMAYEKVLDEWLC